MSNAVTVLDPPDRQRHSLARPTTGARVALLLQNTMEFPSMSMKLYAASLSAALRAHLSSSWQIEMPEVHEPAALACFAGQANASRWSRLVQYPRLVSEMRRRLRSSICHVLDHSHANLLNACDPARSVITIHDVIPMLAAVGELDFKVGRAVRYTFPRKLRQISQCRRIIAISQSTKKQLLRFCNVPEDRIEVIYNGIGAAFVSLESNDARNAERKAVLQRHGIDPGKRIVMHVCTPQRYKNSPALLHALTKLPADVLLLRVGAELFDDEAALVDRLGISSRVINVGTVPGALALAAYYRAADVFAFPSLFEGFGWPAAEAMACGTPVVLSDAGSLPEVGGDAALYCSPHNHDALAGAIDSLLSDRVEHAKRRVAGLLHVRAFTWDLCAQRVLNLYDQVAG